MQTQFLTYTLSQKLGEGGMATVWYAENLLGKRFAIKVLKPGMEAKEKLAERFRLEARMMVSLEHPHIRQVIDYYEDATTMAIIMEYLEGEDLGRHLIEHGPVSEKQAVLWFNDILDAVAYVHQKSYIHRDIKPSNLFLTRNGQIKVMDFGIAKIVNANLELTETNTNIGSPQYMSPEQITTPKAVDYRTDIYSLGVTLYALLTGKKPYDDSYGSAYTVQAEIVKKTLPLVPGVSERVNAAIQKATHKNPAERFQSCREFKDALTEIKPIIVEVDNEKTIIRDPKLVNLPEDIRNKVEIPLVEPVKNIIDNTKKTDDNQNGKVKKPKTVRNLLIAFVSLIVFGGLLYWGWTYIVKGDITKGVELASKGEYIESFNILYKHRDSPYITPEALNHLGYMYSTGLGTQRDYIEALRLYYKAADMGNMASLNNVGAIYQNGWGVSVDYQKAKDCYERAASGGLAKAKYNMGELYFNGYGVDKNYFEAVRWYQQGAEDGDISAQYKLGSAYYNGNGVSRDYSKAESWYRKAADQGHSESQNSMGILYYRGFIGNGVDYGTARFWYEKAAKQDNMYALYNLGYMFEYGEGVLKDWPRAVDYYKRAARLGQADAQKRLNQFAIRW
jgi:TPR repeat protein/serine/threonine protein kinase